MSTNMKAEIFSLPGTKKSEENNRKSGINANKLGSVRKIYGRIYVDFRYLGERVREDSGLKWNNNNVRLVRKQLDQILLSIQKGTFRFASVFPKSKKRDYFTEKECISQELNKTPKKVIFEDEAWIWYNQYKDSGRVSERTLYDYKLYLKTYLIPFFGRRMTFADLDATAFVEFISWVRNQKLKGKAASNKSINKFFIPLKMICRQAAVKYKWGNKFDPFFGFKKLPESNDIDQIKPFTIEEQKKIIEHLPIHWKPYFLFAFSSGLRPGEQMGLKLKDIDWDKKILHIRRALTNNDEGKIIEGKTKNKYSIRDIKMNEAMYTTLKAQLEIYNKFKGEYFFCSPEGKQIHRSNLLRKGWKPTLKKAGIEFRSIKQTRHSFATIALSCGENPLWIAKVMGHRDTNMIIKVYAKYVENSINNKDGNIISNLHMQINSSKLKISNNSEV